MKIFKLKIGFTVLSSFIFLTTCLNPESERSSKSTPQKSYSRYSHSSAQTKVNQKILFDSLVLGSASNSKEITSLGKISNLDILNGYKGLKLGLAKDKIEFPLSVTRNDIYKNWGISEIMIETTCDLMGGPCDLKLQFYQDLLEQVEFKRNHYIDIDRTGTLYGEQKIKIDPRIDPELEETFNLLVSVFGEPNSGKNVILKTRRTDNISINLVGAYYDKYYGKWETSKISLEFFAEINYNIDPKAKLFAKEFKTSESRLTYTNKDHQNDIEKYINQVKDSLSLIDKNKQNKEIIDKF